MPLINVVNTDKFKTVNTGNKSTGTALAPIVIPKIKLNFSLLNTYYKRGSTSSGIGSVRNAKRKVGKT